MLLVIHAMPNKKIRPNDWHHYVYAENQGMFVDCNFIQVLGKKTFYDKIWTFNICSMTIVTYCYIKIVIDFLCRQGLNFKFFIWG